MKNKITKNIIHTFILLGAATLFALPLQAGRGGNGGGGNGGECPQGFEPGTRNTQDCTGARDGTGSQYRSKSGNQGQRRGDGTGTGSGQKQQKKGQGIGNPDDCPNYEG